MAGNIATWVLIRYPYPDHHLRNAKTKAEDSMTARKSRSFWFVMLYGSAVATAVPLAPIPAQAQVADASRAAAEILEATQIQGGLIVHLGCGDGRLTVALRAADGFQVQGLDRDPTN